MVNSKHCNCRKTVHCRAKKTISLAPVKLIMAKLRHKTNITVLLQIVETNYSQPILAVRSLRSKQEESQSINSPCTKKQKAKHAWLPCCDRYTVLSNM